MEGSTTYFLRFLLAFAVLSPFKDGVLAQLGDTLSLGKSLTGNQTLISKNGTFELGFFSPGENNNWYVGIWYVQLPETVFWVANRETPLKNMPGVLNLSREGRLGLFDANGVSIWLVNGTNKTSGVVLLDSGNFVMMGAEGETEGVWESFDHPTDTWLPGMKIGADRKLISWKNSVDPALGTFSFSIETNSSGGLLGVLRWNDSVVYWKSGAWNGKVFLTIPEMSAAKQYNYSTVETGSVVYLIYSMLDSVRYLPRFVMDKAGGFQIYLLYGGKWNLGWSKPVEQCEVYGLCGSFGICDSSMNQFCTCLQGYEPRDEKAWDLQKWWSSGCVRRNPFNCDAENVTNDDFINLDAWLPDNNNRVFSQPAQTEKDCKNACLHNCSCNAFQYKGNVCQTWSGDLLNMGNAQSNNDSALFARVAASESGTRSSSKGRTSKVGPVVGIVVACAIVLTIFACLFSRRRWKISNQGLADRFSACLAKSTSPEANEVDATSIRMFTYKELQIATRNFTHKLGSGAFGSVFRGALPDGTLVAVKRLQGVGDGEKQFRAEINTVGNIHHVNLIRLRGFCAEKSHSKDPKNERKVVDWKTRFEITLGIARGLVYLHEECKERIIHCDVKPENILLDDNFCTKLADFGLAKLVGRDFSRVLTTTRGTRGYLAPEWIAGLPITPKVDVYSFGMTLLEIISGRRTLDLSVQESNKLYFPTWAATQIQKEDMMSVVDSRIANSADVEELRRAVVVSMLCIQDDDIVRPTMGQVLLMLEGKMKCPTPQIPRSLLGQQEGIEDKDNSSAPQFKIWDNSLDYSAP